MASAQPYSGPKALGYSKYAPQSMKFPFVAPFASSSTASTSPTADNVIATKEQIAASNTNSQVADDIAQHNPDVELALAQDTIFRKEVEQHEAKLSSTISDKVVNTRRLLELMRKACPEATNATVDALWVELEDLFAAANRSKTALAGFLEKQRDNLGLYHASMMNETIRETQDELNIAHKKVNIQHSLILQHQEAFQNHKAQTESKLKDVESLKDRTSRLTLEKGNLRTELDECLQQLEQERSQIAKYALETESVQKEFDMLVGSNKQLNDEVNTLRKKLEDVHGKQDATEQEIADRFSARLKSSADSLAKETDKIDALNAMVFQLKEAGNTARLNIDKAEKENAALQAKYNIQSAEHGKAFTKLNEQTKQMEDLKINIDRLQKDNCELKQRLAKLADLEKEVIELQQAKATLLEQIETLALKKEAAIVAERQARSTVEDTLYENKTLQKTIDDLKAEHSMVAGKLKDNVETLQRVSSEKVELKTAIDELKAVRSTSTGSSGSSDPNLEEKTRIQDQKIRELEHNVEEWTELAHRSYAEYRELLPLSKQAEHYRQEALNKNDVVKSLELQLAEAKALQSTDGATNGGDTRYWKSKYEQLLATIDT